MCVGWEVENTPVRVAGPVSTGEPVGGYRDFQVFTESAGTRRKRDVGSFEAIFPPGRPALPARVKVRAVVTLHRRA